MSSRKLFYTKGAEESRYTEAGPAQILTEAIMILSQSGLEDESLLLTEALVSIALGHQNPPMIHIEVPSFLDPEDSQ